MESLAFCEPVTLVGGGSLTAEGLALARSLAPRLVAADGAANRLGALGVTPDAIVGDMDSIEDQAAWCAAGVPLSHLTEQDTTDFEKCLYATEAPFYLAAGFTGRRLDHTLAVLHAMLARPKKRVALLGEEDAAIFVPPGREVTLSLQPGARVSVFPLVPVRAAISEGLEWPIDGMAFAPGEQVGTSNRAATANVRMQFEGPGALVLVEIAYLETLISVLKLPS